MTSVSALGDFYRSIEVAAKVEMAPEYAQLVVPNGNGEQPVHRWFRLKEAYSSRLLTQVLKDTGFAGASGLRVLDPYSGSGTTQVSLAEAVERGDITRPCVYGLERNAFLHLVASAKFGALQAPPQEFEKFIAGLCASALASRAVPDLPGLSTFHRADYFDSGDVRQLMRLRAAIECAESDGAAPVPIALAKLCLGAVVEMVSNLRRDGRALRFTTKSGRPAPVHAFRAKAGQVAADLPARGVPIEGRVLLGDGRRYEGIDGRFRPFDLVVFSPPYPNNIDYTEVYKLENWLLGYIESGPAFMDQRLKTVYSHPSVLRPDSLPSSELSKVENAAVARSVKDVVESVPDDRYREARIRMLRGYALDMFLTLRGAAERLAPDGRVVYVVGNSVHGRPPGEFVIAADLIMASVASAAGLEVERIAVARMLRRRVLDSPFLRESVVFLKSPAIERRSASR